MKYQKTAQEIFNAVGGNENIQTATHCITRLRLILKDQTKVDDERVKAIPGVMGVMKKAGQYHIILGNDVANYYRAFIKLGNFDSDQPVSTEKKNLFENLVDVISGCMSPLIPALLGGGMIKVLLIILPLIGALNEASSTYAVLSFFGDAPFYFMPIMLAFTASQKFGVTPMLAVAVGGIMLHPNFAAMVAAGDPISILGLPITSASYGSSVIPILIMVWLMKYIEAFFNRIIPAVMKTVLQPLLVLLLSGVIALVVVGPLGTFAGQGLSAAVLWIQDKAGWLALGMMSALMPLIVMTGMHWAFAPLFLIASPATPDVLILPAMLAANIAQGAAAMAVSAKAKDKNLKQVALAAGISALLAGVTEPALYGVTLKYKKPLYAAMIAGGICGIFMGITGVESYAFAVPSLVAIPQFINGTIDSNFINACIVAAASIGITFALTWFFGFEEELTTEDAVLEVVSSGSSDPKKVLAPVKGKVIPLEKVNDSAFSSKVMGEGIAIIPEENTIVAPFDGTVSAIFPTKHAIGLTSEAGMELLIHVGIDTVELNGQYFESLVSVGDLVKAGQALLTVDFAAVKAAGYDPVVPIVVTNSETFIDVVPKDEMQSANYDDAVLYVI